MLAGFDGLKGDPLKPEVRTFQTETEAREDADPFKGFDVSELQSRFTAIKKTIADQEANAEIRAQQARQQWLVEQRMDVVFPNPEEKAKALFSKITDAVNSGQEKVEIGRWDADILEDRGRKIDGQVTDAMIERQSEKMTPISEGWEKDLLGEPKAVYELWRDYLKTKGIKLFASIDNPYDKTGKAPGTLIFHLAGWA